MNLINLTFLVVLGFKCQNVYGMYSNKSMEGYPEGYMADCPGSTKPAIITKKSLKYLGMVVVGDKTENGYPKRVYNYYQASKIAKDPNLDFKNRKTVFFIGGFLDSPHFFVSSMMAEQYKSRNYNVILMEANKFLTMHYPIATRYMRPVGLHLAEMLTNITAAGMDLNTFELVGVSLGGQTISFVAKNFYRLTGTKLKTLVGLDPSGPCFRNLGPDERLDQTDAEFVQTLNTNIDGFGMAAPVGHVNFYVNGGEYQPGDIYWMPCNVLCSHVRSYTMWIAALNHPNSFIGLKCDSIQQARRRACYDRVPLETNVLGNKVNRTNQGLFYLATKSDFPYYLGKKGLKKENEFWNKALQEMNSQEVMSMK